MHETLLHVREPLTPPRHETLCRVLGEHGATCETRFRSRRPQLLFIGYSKAGPGQLVAALSSAGLSARVVDA